MTYTYINGFSTDGDAEAYRCKLRHPEKYGVYGIVREDSQLWCVIPTYAIRIIMSGEDDTRKEL